MKINRDARIGRVLFVVEGSQTEFSILRRIFCGLLGYSYIEKRRNKPDYFIRENDKYSTVAVVNTANSNIKYIGTINQPDAYLESIFNVLRTDYHFPVDEAAVYFLFDRDPCSNANISLIQKYILTLTNPYGDGSSYIPGQLLLSYPSIESYEISHFVDNSSTLRFSLGRDVKKYIGNNHLIQLNKMSKDTLVKAAHEFVNYLERENISYNIDDFAAASYSILTKQECEYARGKGFKAFSMLTLAFLQMNIIVMND